MRRGSVMLDSFIELYDKDGNQIELTVGDRTSTSKYDQNGFLTWSKSTQPSESLETNYINDDKGRILKSTRSDGIIQAFVYDKDGNVIQETDLFDPKGKANDYLTGYCEFDKNGNYLKRITACKQKKEAFMDKRVIEYY
ncbi:MAG: hypothetical protein JSS82_09285 [Bacteroidetes bacterium]|nr:hypothetical protein [Bacteroidota bacterium]